jgi:hypothetical protein
MKRTLPFIHLMITAGVLVLLARETGIAAPPPPPPPVPTGDIFTQFAAGGGIAAFGAYRLWKAKRAVKKMEKE